ncbi:MAG: rRNA maturation RNase YbeY [candidate division Zixibacteria bacterium]|nr:rRNA maturation RNase YbeY [candidate division Zixibacteria bacterium]
MMKLYIFKEVSARVPRQKIFNLFDKIMSKETEPDASSRVNLVFTTKKRIRQLNKSHRQIDKATDVLSFKLGDSSGADSVFGEIYISPAVARVQAPEFANTFSDELLRLCCHGLLHLLGYDHLKKSDAVKMRKRETYFLSLTKLEAGVS